MKNIAEWIFINTLFAFANSGAVFLRLFYPTRFTSREAFKVSYFFYTDSRSYYIYYFESEIVFYSEISYILRLFFFFINLIIIALSVFDSIFAVSNVTLAHKYISLYFTAFYKKIYLKLMFSF